MPHKMPRLKTLMFLFLGMWVVFVIQMNFSLIRIEYYNPDENLTSGRVEGAVASMMMSNGTTLTNNKTSVIKDNKTDLHRQTLSEYLLQQSKQNLQTDTIEFWFYIKSQLSQLRNGDNSKIGEQIDNILNISAGYQRTILNDLDKLSLSQNVSRWEQESKHLTKMVQQRLDKLQNPPDCSKTPMVICSLSKPCGFGCILHHIAWCVTMAYATQRTLVMTGEIKYKGGSLDDYFLSLDKQCHGRSNKDVPRWTGINDTTLVVTIPPVDSIKKELAPFLPPVVPQDLAESLYKFHGLPIAWWLGQIVAYIMRPQAEFEDYLEKTKKLLGFQHPIVGIHIRRTDKLKHEASFHDVKEYMDHVEQYYLRMDLLNQTSNSTMSDFEHKGHDEKHRVYLATDDPNVLVEARAKYPTYTFLSENDIAPSMSSRYTKDSLRGVIFDMMLLSECDYIVCTFSSQVCRVAYELMQTKHIDASTKVTSLDDIYYYGGQSQPYVIAVEPHIPNKIGEIALRVGDRIAIAGNKWNGFSVGRNGRTNKYGDFPSFKTELEKPTANFEDFSVFRDR